MAEIIATKALTNLERVKTRLTLTDSGFDTLLERMIMAVTVELESRCNRKFAEATYTNEVYSVHNGRMEMLALNNTPVTALTSFQYRAGTPSNPSWTSFIADEYEISGDGKSGLIKVYGGVPAGVNAVRATYTAGYKIDWSPAEDSIDPTKHTLPFDLTDLAERLVVKRFKKREAEGKDTESFDGGTVSWSSFIDKDDQAIISRYSRLPTFV